MLKKYLALFGITFSLSTNAVTIFSSSMPFLGSVDKTVIDDYQSVGYEHGDIGDYPINDKFSDTAMSSVFGETQYKATSYPDSGNSTGIYVSWSNDRYYCGGCNGSFELNFSNTSVSMNGGVYGVGLDIGSNLGDPNGIFRK
jgi:hypothetical protein